MGATVLPSSNLSVLVLLSMVLLLTQCAPMSHKQEWVPNRPETKVMPANSEVVRTAVERVLVKKFYSLDPEKSNSLHLQTEWLEEGKYRNMIKADLKPVGKSKTEVTHNDPVGVLPYLILRLPLFFEYFFCGRITYFY